MANDILTILKSAQKKLATTDNLKNHAEVSRLTSLLAHARLVDLAMVEVAEDGLKSDTRAVIELAKRFPLQPAHLLAPAGLREQAHLTHETVALVAAREAVAPINPSLELDELYTQYAAGYINQKQLNQGLDIVSKRSLLGMGHSVHNHFTVELITPDPVDVEPFTPDVGGDVDHE